MFGDIIFVMGEEQTVAAHIIYMPDFRLQN